MRVLLVTPPLVQLNTPYPATTHLYGFLHQHGYDVRQADAGLSWFLRLVSSSGLQRMRAALVDATPTGLSGGRRARRPASVQHFLDHATHYETHAGAVLEFLQNRDLSLAHRIAGRQFLPEGPRFAALGPPGEEEEYLHWAFGALGVVDRARYFATLFLEQIVDAVHDGIDPHVAFARYGDSLVEQTAELAPLIAEARRLERPTAMVLDEVAAELCALHEPDVVAITVPFPGTVLGALRLAVAMRRHQPGVHIVWGGGWVNTELRSLGESELFDLVDAVCYDDGERPLRALLDHWAGRSPASSLVRTRARGAVGVPLPESRGKRGLRPDLPAVERGTPAHAGLPLREYLALLDDPNPMQRLWSETRWNKLLIAHGCYWRRCSFCDTSLPYICAYEPVPTTVLVDRMEALIQETGCRGFHFVDEAAPPAALAALAEEILRRRLTVSFWGNVRFEKTFRPELCRLLARAGCIAVTAGLETPHPRLLELVDKGVTLEQVAHVTRAFSDAGIRVHAYLIYGAPTQTVQETVDGLEYVRQLFAHGCLDSAFWHRLAVTAHSPMGREPARFGIELGVRPPNAFAHNELPFSDGGDVDHLMLGAGLRRAVYNFMHGLGIAEDVRTWFDVPVPRPKLKRRFVGRLLAQQPEVEVRSCVAP